jgi:hypothetical protein
MARHATARHGTAWHATPCHGTCHATPRHAMPWHGTAAPCCGMRAHGGTARPQTWQARCPGMGHHDAPLCSPPRCAAPWHGAPRHGTARWRRGVACGPMVARHGPKLGRLGATALGITTHHGAARHDVLHHGMPWHGTAAAAWHGVVAPRLGMRAHGSTARPQTLQTPCHDTGRHGAPWCSLP